MLAALRASRPWERADLALMALAPDLAMNARQDSFGFGGPRIAYDDYGGGPRTLVLVHGLMMNRHMYGHLAPELSLARAQGDHRRPARATASPTARTTCAPTACSTFADQLAALIEYLELDRPVVGGTSLGANVSLELASRRPEAARGLFIEMPVLDNALVAAGLIFLPALLMMRAGRPLLRLGSMLANAVPRTHFLVDILLDWARRDPETSEAVLSGLLFGRIAPPARRARRIELPTLIVGHPSDPLHPFSDSDMLLGELPHARLVNAESILEWRIRPGRLDDVLLALVRSSRALRLAERVPLPSPRR